MSPRAARAISFTVAAVALALIIVALPVSLAARDVDRAAIVVVPEPQRAGIEGAIERGGGCPEPSVDDRSLVDAVDAYCRLQERAAHAELFSTVGPADPFTIVASVVGLLWIGTGFLIVSRRGSNLAGWVFEVVGLGLVMLNAALTLSYVGIAADRGSIPAVGLWAIVNEYSFLVIALLPMLWLLFPDGKPPTPRWRVWIRVYVAALAVVTVVAVLLPGPLNNLVEYGIIYMNPIGVPWLADVGGAILAVGVLTILVFAVTSVFATRRRFKRATGEERQQLRWLRFVITVAVILFLLDFVGSLILGFVFGDDGSVDSWLTVFIALLALTLAFGLPAAYLVAIFRYGLWELDVVIRKTLIVAVVGIAMTVIGVGLLLLIYMLTLGVGGTLDGEALIPILVGLTLGLLFGPIRRRARRLADRVVYGRRATPYEVLSSFTDRLGGTYSADDVLPRMAQVLAQATGADAAHVWLRIGGQLRPEAVWPDDAETPPATATARTELPPLPGSAAEAVRDHGELLGALTVSMPANDPIDPARSKLMADLATQAGLVLRNVRLIEDLRASRQRLVAAQDEERRKLERDIHDGVQQQLVALSVKLRLAEQMTTKDPARAQVVLGGLQTDATDALEDLRDLARGIYPPLLADKGLTAAIEAQARKSVVPTTVSSDGVERYPRDIESTVYFCTLEAMNNVAKYAQATAAAITLAQHDGTLEFRVRDDGSGFDVEARASGTGLQGIADRIEAVGGSVTIESRPGEGTEVLGRVPVAHRT